MASISSLTGSRTSTHSQIALSPTLSLIDESLSSNASFLPSLSGKHFSAIRNRHNSQAHPTDDQTLLISKTYSKSSSITELEHLITCPIHLGVMESPRILHCGHVYCTNCLIDNIKSLQKSSSLATNSSQILALSALDAASSVANALSPDPFVLFYCPVCRKPCRLQRETVNHLPPSYLHKQLADLIVEKKNRLLVKSLISGARSTRRVSYNEASHVDEGEDHEKNRKDKSRKNDDSLACYIENREVGSPSNNDWKKYNNKDLVKLILQQLNRSDLKELQKSLSISGNEIHKTNKSHSSRKSRRSKDHTNEANSNWIDSHPIDLTKSLSINNAMFATETGQTENSNDNTSQLAQNHLEVPTPIISSSYQLFDAAVTTVTSNNSADMSTSCSMTSFASTSITRNRSTNLTVENVSNVAGSSEVFSSNYEMMDLVTIRETMKKHSDYKIWKSFNLNPSLNVIMESQSKRMQQTGKLLSCDFLYRIGANDRVTSQVSGVSATSHISSGSDQKSNLQKISSIQQNNFEAEFLVFVLENCSKIFLKDLNRNHSGSGVSGSSSASQSDLISSFEIRPSCLTTANEPQVRESFEPYCIRCHEDRIYVNGLLTNSSNVSPGSNPSASNLTSGMSSSFVVLFIFNIQGKLLGQSALFPVSNCNQLWQGNFIIKPSSCSSSPNQSITTDSSGSASATNTPATATAAVASPIAAYASSLVYLALPHLRRIAILESGSLTEISNSGFVFESVSPSQLELVSDQGEIWACCPQESRIIIIEEESGQCRALEASQIYSSTGSIFGLSSIVQTKGGSNRLIIQDSKLNRLFWIKKRNDFILIQRLNVAGLFPAVNTTTGVASGAAPTSSLSCMVNLTSSLSSTEHDNAATEEVSTGSKTNCQQIAGIHMMKCGEDKFVISMKDGHVFVVKPVKSSTSHKNHLCSIL